MEFQPAPLSGKAVMIVKTPDGGVLVFTIYDPVVNVSYEDAFSDRATASLTYREGKLVQTDPSSEEAQKKIEEVYAEARREALIRESESMSLMPSGDDLIAMNFRTHSEAIQAVYQHGVEQGAQLVEFPDEHFENEKRQEHLRGVDAAYNAVNTLVVARSGTRFEKGLKRARRAISELRQRIKETS